MALATNANTSDKSRRGASALLEDLGVDKLIPKTTIARPEGGGAAKLLEDINRGGGVGNVQNTLSKKEPSRPKQEQQQQQQQHQQMLEPSTIEPEWITPDVPSQPPMSTPLPPPRLPSPITRTPEPTPRISSMPAQGTSGYMSPSSMRPSTMDIGDVTINPLLGIDPEREEWQTDWEKAAAEREGRSVRTHNFFGGRYDTNDDGMLWFDNQIGAVGNTPTNDTYLRDAVANGLPKDEAKKIYDRMTEDKSYLEQLFGGKYNPFRDWIKEPADVNKDSAGDFMALDDGSVMDYDHMTSDKMTGTQYRHYVELGMGGRPIDEIDPKGVYSKRREANEHGFIPFTPDDTALANMATMNLVEAPGRIGSLIANARNELMPDYSISVGDKTVSGKEYDKKASAYVNEYQDTLKRHPMRYLRPNGDATPFVREIEVPDWRGVTTYHYGSLTSVREQSNGNFRVEFSDGSSVETSRDFIDSKTDENDNISFDKSGLIPVSEAHGRVPSNIERLNDIGDLERKARENGGTILDYADAAFIPDMVMSDGTRLTYDEVNRMFFDKSPENDDGKDDDDISYDITRIGPIVSNEPARFRKELFSAENGFDLSDAGDNLIDWTLGSVPISTGAFGGYFPLMYSLSNAATAGSGADPGTYDPATDSYQLVAGGYDGNGNYRYGVNDGKTFDEDLSYQTKIANMLGNALVPLTENLAGNVGSDPFKAYLQNAGVLSELPKNPLLGQLVKNTAIDMTGEGIEEIIGNIFDDLTQYGLRGYGANPILDNNGNQLYDAAGHELRDYNTPLGQRIANLNPFSNFESSFNSFLGGAGVSGMMDLARLLAPPLRKGSTWGVADVARAARRSLAAMENGVDPYIEPEEQEYRKVPKRYLDTFSNELT